MTENISASLSQWQLKDPFWRIKKKKRKNIIITEMRESCYEMYNYLGHLPKGYRLQEFIIRNMCLGPGCSTI